jgi:hypothetical protein
MRSGNDLDSSLRPCERAVLPVIAERAPRQRARTLTLFTVGQKKNVHGGTAAAAAAAAAAAWSLYRQMQRIGVRSTETAKEEAWGVHAEWA